jgi:hypothetical protein
MWGRYYTCEILIASPIDWLFAACLEYIILFSIDSSEAMSRYILNKDETSNHLILIRLYFTLTILITEDDHNHVFFNNCNSAGFFS